MLWGLPWWAWALGAAGAGGVALVAAQRPTKRIYRYGARPGAGAAREGMTRGRWAARTGEELVIGDLDAFGRVKPNAAAFGALVAAAAEQGPYHVGAEDEESQRNLSTLLALVDRASAYDDPVELMTLARDIAIVGIDRGASPPKIPAEWVRSTSLLEPSMKNAVWVAWKRRTAAADAIVDWWTTPALNGFDGPGQMRAILDWKHRLNFLPFCNDEPSYQGHSMDQIYERNQTADCMTRRRVYEEWLNDALARWGFDEGRATRGEYTEAELATFPAAMREVLRDITHDKMIVWPGGPATEVDTAQAFAMMFQWLVIAASSVLAAFSAGSLTGAVVASAGGLSAMLAAAAEGLEDERLNVAAEVASLGSAVADDVVAWVEDGATLAGAVDRGVEAGRGALGI